jgi:hypothetical protein
MYDGFYQKMLGRLLAIHTIFNQTVAREQALRMVQMLGQRVNIRGSRVCLFLPRCSQKAYSNRSACVQPT